MMKPVTRAYWRLRADCPPRQHVIRFAEQLGLTPLTAQTLIMRGQTEVDGARRFLAARLNELPDPQLLPNMKAACERLTQALLAHEKIFIHGDYDVDGMTGCALLVEGLRALGGVVDYHIPLRLVEGYGLSPSALRQAADRGYRLVVSVDCGVAALAEAELARDLSLDLIITDHHQPSSQLPECLALINPHLSENRFPTVNLAGVGVAFMLLVALQQHLREQGYFRGRSEPDLRNGLDLVALGTIADIVPLDGVNRVLVKAGLKLLQREARPGLTALKRVAAVREVSSGAVGFRLAPRLNAAGRLEDAAQGVQLLLDQDPDRVGPLAAQLDSLNRQRQELEKATLKMAVEQIESDFADDLYTLVLADDSWHPGVIGIVASRLVERYHRPAVLIAWDDGVGKGSGRSIAPFDLYQGLATCQHHLQAFGGHAMAAGISLNRGQFEDFRQVFDAAVRASLSRADLIPTQAHDGEVDLAQLDMAQLGELEQLAPCGAGNPQPNFVSRACRISAPRVLADRHLKFKAVHQGCVLDCIAFGQAARINQLEGSQDLLFRPQINEWRGQRTVQLLVQDFRPAQLGRDADA